MSLRRAAIAAAIALAAALPQPGASATASGGGHWRPTLTPSIEVIGTFPNGVGYLVGQRVRTDQDRTHVPLYRTADYGHTWTRVQPGIPTADTFASAVFTSPTDGWAFDGHRTLSATHDGGATWSAAATLPLPANQGFWWGEVAATSDGGISVNGTPARPACLADLATAVFWSSDSGATWTRSDVPGHLHSVSMADRFTGIAQNGIDPNPSCDSYSSFSGVTRTTDGGGTWQRVFDPPPGRNTYQATAVSQNTLLLAVSDGTVRTSDDGGQTYTSTFLGTPTPVVFEGSTPMISVDAVGDTYYAGAQDGRIWRSTDAGGTWTQEKGASALFGTFVTAFDADHALAFDLGIAWIRG